jgi:mono/diheme cytochrome c family protein
VRSWLVAVVAAFALAGCERAPSRRADDGSAGVAKAGPDGRDVFQSMCATCHGPDGRPSGAMAARLGVRDLTSGEFRARVTPALVEQQVRTGSKNKLMPSFEGALDDAQIKAVAAFVASPALGQPAARDQAAPPAPSAPPGAPP